MTTKLSIVKPEEVCTICSGTGWENVPGRGARPCKCKEDAKRIALVESAEIPKRYRNSSLENYTPQPGDGRNSQLAALRAAHKFVTEFDPEKKGLLLMGPCGVGKTHLGVAVIRALALKRGIHCLFVDSRELLKQIQDSYNPESTTTELQVTQRYESVPLLMLDEIGASKSSEWALETLTRIINARYVEMLPTIFTTNYYLESQGADSLAERIGARLISRLYEMCVVVIVAGDDYRKRGAK